MLAGPGSRQLGHSQSHWCQRVSHLMGNPARDFPERPKPFGLDLLRTGPLQCGSHFPQRGAERLELRGTPARPIGRERLQPANVPGPPDQLLDRSAELAREMPAEADRGIDERGAKEKNDQAQPGVVVAAEGIRALKLTDG